MMHDAISRGMMHDALAFRSIVHAVFNQQPNANMEHVRRCGGEAYEHHAKSEFVDTC